MLNSAPLRLGGAVAAVAVVAVVAGCSSGGSSSSSAASAPASSAAVSSASASAAPSSAPASAASSSAAAAPRVTASSASSSPAVAGAPGCATRDLRAKAGVAQGAAGSVYQVIVFTNVSSTTCTMYGYPGVSLAAGSPVTQVGQAAARSTETSPTMVTLAPGKNANALLRITQALNYPTAKCSPTKTTYLQIYPPNQTTPTYLAYPATGCASSAVNILTISVVQAGAGSGGQ